MVWSNGQVKEIFQIKDNLRGAGQWADKKKLKSE
jgi:hypothetical protein